MRRLNLLLSFYLLCFLPLKAWSGDYCERLTAPLSFERIKDFTRRCQIKDLTHLLQKLPEIYYRNFVLGYSSRAPEAYSISTRFPRVISYDPLYDGAILAFTTDAHKAFYQNLQILEFNQNEGKFKIGEIAFVKKSPQRAKRLTLKISDSKQCQRCHTQNNLPIWASFRYWRGFYGAVDDRPYETNEVNQGDKADYEILLSRWSKDRRLKLFSKNNYKKEDNKVDFNVKNNGLLSQHVAHLWSLWLYKKYFSKNPLFVKLALLDIATLNSSLGCLKVDEGHSLSKMMSDLTKDNKSLFSMNGRYKVLNLIFLQMGFDPKDFNLPFSEVGYLGSSSLYFNDQYVRDNFLNPLYESRFLPGVMSKLSMLSFVREFKAQKEKKNDLKHLSKLTKIVSKNEIQKFCPLIVRQSKQGLKQFKKIYHNKLPAFAHNPMEESQDFLKVRCLGCHMGALPTAPEIPFDRPQELSSEVLKTSLLYVENELMPPRDLDQKRKASLPLEDIERREIVRYLQALLAQKRLSEIK